MYRFKVHCGQREKGEKGKNLSARLRKGLEPVLVNPWFTRLYVGDVRW